MTVSINYEIAGGGTGASSTSGSVGGGLATSSGSDLTALTLVSGGDADGQPAEYTAGLQYDVTRDGSGIPQSLDVVGTSLSSTLTRVGTSNYYTIDSADPYYISGALVLTLTQMRDLETAANSALTTISKGFRVFVSDVGSYTSPAGVTITPGAFAHWVGDEFWWTNGVVYRTDQHSATHTGTASQSASLADLVIPAKVLGKRGTVQGMQRTVFAGTAGAGTKSLVWQVNGNTFASASGLANNVLYSQIRKSLNNDGVVNSQEFANTGGTDVSTSSTSALASLAIDTSTTALTFGIKITLITDTAEQATVVKHALLVTNNDILT